MTISKFFESYKGYLSGTIVLVLYLFCRESVDISGEMKMLSPFMSIGGALFGFMLTLLGIILQGQTKLINEMKKNDYLFKRMVQFNRSVVLKSIVVVIILFYLPAILKLIECIKNTNFQIYALKWVHKGVFGLIWAAIMCVLIEALRFVRVFYMLIKYSQSES